MKTNNYLHLLLFPVLLFVGNVMGQSQWTLSNTGVTPGFRASNFITASPSVIYTPGNIYSSVQQPAPGFCKTTDNGNSWTALTVTGLQNHNLQYIAGVAAGSKMFVSAAQSTSDFAVYSSSNGTSWSLSNTGLPAKFRTGGFMAVSPSEIYAVGKMMESSPSDARIYKTVNGGSGWTQVTTSGLPQDHDYFYGPATVAGGKMLLAFFAYTNSAVNYIYSSTDGTNWIPSHAGLPADFSAYDFIVDGSTGAVYVLGDRSNVAALYKSNDGGSSWSVLTTTGMENHSSRYVSGTKSGNLFFINAINSTGNSAIYKSTGLAGLDEAAGAMELTLFPNPATDRLTVQTQFSGPKSITVVDIQGKILLAKQEPGGKTYFDIAIDGIPSGTYLLQVKTKGNVYTRKFVKQ